MPVGSPVLGSFSTLPGPSGRKSLSMPLSFRASELTEAGVGVAPDGQSLADREVAFDRDDLATVQDQVRLVGPRGRAAEPQRQEQAGKPREGAGRGHGRDSRRSLPGGEPVPARTPPS